MTEAERSKYDGRDMVILNRHTEDTIQEDKLSFPMQMENHFAHVRMLWEQGILTHKEARAISAALRKLLAAGLDATGRRPGLTDLFSNLEEWLIEELGIEVGGKFHTGRSRNDMNLTIERMYTRKTLLDMCEAVSFLMDTLLRKAEEHKNTIIPGYTHHSQHAQPVTLGHFYLSAFENFARDLERLLAAYDHTNLSPMGGAAIATTGFPINRERVAELLGFDGLLLNSMNATSSLDFAYEAASAMCIFIQNVGRMAESLLLWNMGEVGISRLNLKYCSYSTIMPQKRNPVALETLRYSGEWSYGALSTMFNTMKAYTPGNGREPGFVVSLYYEIAQRVMDSAYLLEGIVRTLEVDRERALDMTRKGFSTMTELADELDAKATQTSLAEVSADVTAEAAARAGGDSALSSRVSSLESSVPQKARVYYTSYTGNSGSRSFSLSFSPKLVILASDDYSVCTPKAPMAVAQGKTVSYSGVTLASLSGKTLSVSADSGYNNSGVSYAVLAIT